MKYVLVRIRRNECRPRLRYPEVYNAQEVEANKRGPHVYSGGILKEDGDLEELLLLLRDHTADKYATHEDVDVLTPAQVDEWLASNTMLPRDGSELVTDPNRIQVIIAKQLAGMELTEQDLAALDPDQDEPGVCRYRRTRKGLFGRED